MQLLYETVGRRKRSSARIKVTLGTGKIIINKKESEAYFNNDSNYLNEIKLPLKHLELENKYDILISVAGGGLSGQTDAVKLAIARALCKINLENRPTLKEEGLLTCDSRIKERKKYGLKKARKASQYSKR